MRCFFGFLCACVLGVMPLVGCADEGGGTGGVVLDLGITRFMHANLNVSDFERSHAFYETLGFASLLDVEESVSAEQAAALDMPPYTYRASAMIIPDGMIDLMHWKDPYDGSPPYPSLFNLGLVSIALSTSDIDADVALLADAGVEFVSEPVGTERDAEYVRFVFLKDEDGIAVELVEAGDDDSGTLPGPDAKTHVTGFRYTTLNCSDLDRSRAFYEMLGFTIGETTRETGTAELAKAYGLDSYDLERLYMTLGDGAGIDLVAWNAPYDGTPPYEHLNHLGIGRIALETTDIDGDVEKLKGKGVKFYSEPMRMDGAFSTFRVVFFEDPDGVVIELVELGQ
jgi:catechol 2,3-dioxygenase-like lactoylglutathione lyase family enzyme